MNSNGYSIYKNNSVNYASKDQLLLMLLDGAVRFAKRAELALQENDVKKTHENLVKTQDIFTELMVTLDTDAGEWAKQIFRVYRFINEKLIETNMKKDIKILQETIPLIQDIRDIWYEAQGKNKASGQ
ncbi:flagellar export chaperone FliS [Clostridium vincentii]|uniref:Flagellar secretion chaperone FliS n=1 Tax=Clostridium vincentii TaxID=52704 RepID=A0A2T0BG37_9CLOT|nr:flagellar export chaperone FliS [Clostridium vincentii]PRR82839.1 Flagellar protein FliS [Clostridium vincentii]